MKWKHVNFEHSHAWLPSCVQWSRRKQTTKYVVLYGTTINWRHDIWIHKRPLSNNRLCCAPCALTKLLHWWQLKCWRLFAVLLLLGNFCVIHFALRRVTSDYSSTLHQSPVAICLWIQMHFPFHEQFINSSFSIGKRFFEFLTSISYNILSRDAKECNIGDSTDYSFWTNKYMNNEWRLVTRFFFYYSRLMRNKIRPLLWLCIICSRVRKQRVIIKKQTPNKKSEPLVH